MFAIVEIFKYDNLSFLLLNLIAGGAKRAGEYKLALLAM